MILFNSIINKIEDIMFFFLIKVVIYIKVFIKLISLGLILEDVLKVVFRYVGILWNVFLKFIKLIKSNLCYFVYVVLMFWSKKNWIVILFWFFVFF